MKSLSDENAAVRPGQNENPVPGDWRSALQDAVRCPYELCELLDLPRGVAEVAEERGFATLVPRSFVARMRRGDRHDPLLLQVLPRPEEATGRPAPLDAVGDLAAVRRPALLQKYHGRALLMLGSRCAVNCRYCFRRHFPYSANVAADSAIQSALDAVCADPSIAELILSGGDPLIASDAKVSRAIDAIARIGHVRRLRLHTRLPVVLPERVTATLCEAIARTRLTTVVVLHINHANEIDADVADAVAALRRAAGAVLCQSVLLRGVNDSVDALEALSERLLEIGVLPYYLHQLDVVAGVSHFEVSVEEGKRLIRRLRERLPGYAVPRYVREVAGEAFKSVLA